MDHTSVSKRHASLPRLWLRNLWNPPSTWWRTAIWLASQFLILVSAVVVGQRLRLQGWEKLELGDWADIATVGGAVAAVLALIYTGVQIQQNTKSHRAEFWLTLRQMFWEHQRIHFKLRNYEWSNDDTNYPSEEDWAELEVYLGLLEHCEIMLTDGLLDASTFEDVYGYRLKLLISNPLIVRDKLILRRGGWKRLIHLIQRMEIDERHLRYICGFRDRHTRKWKLWWGEAGKEEGVQIFDTWDDLERSYHEHLWIAVGQRKEFAYMWLIADSGVVHPYSCARIQHYGPANPAPPRDLPAILIDTTRSAG